MRNTPTAQLDLARCAVGATNVGLPSGEIDIVPRDGEGLVFVEVRTRRGDRFGSPEESVTPAKLERLANLGHEYVGAHGSDADWRIDTVALDVDRSGRASRIRCLRRWAASRGAGRAHGWR